MRAVLATLLLCACAACSGKASPPGVSDPGDVPQISGTERLGWTQPANGSDNPASYRFFLYIDGGSRSELPNVSCAPSSSAFDCSGRLPGMPAGTHTLELSAAASDGIESARSAPLTVLVVRAVASAATASAAQSGANAASLDPASAGLHSQPP